MRERASEGEREGGEGATRLTDRQRRTRLGWRVGGGGGGGGA